MKTVKLRLNNESNYFMREAFNTLRTNILFCGNSIKTIAITSCFAHEGKTTVALETARSLADFGKRVLLIDADLRKSVLVSRYTEQSGIEGLSQLLSGQSDLAATVYHTQFENLDIIFAGPYPPNPTELVGSDAFHQLIEAVKPHYDYVIIDTPPLGLVIDAAVISEICDGAIVVLYRGKVKIRMAQGMIEQLRKSGCKVLGAVLNEPLHSRRIGSAKDYSSYYYYRGKKSDS